MFNLLIGTAFLLSSFSYQLNDIYLGGENIVFEMKPEGVIVTGSYDVRTINESYNPSKHSDIQTGDIIISVNDVTINSIKEFLGAFSLNESNESVNLKIIRNKAEINRKLKVCKIDNQIKTGLFIKERVLGVGTLTFIDTDNQIYGALGHEVIDNSNNSIIEVYKGNIYKEEVINVSKGTNGNPGEKVSTTNLKDNIGTIISNTNYGIFGNIDPTYQTSYAIEMASRNEVKLGKATLLTCIKGNEVEEFDIQIIHLKKQSSQDLKGITFKITDKRLINNTGGVFSGMSGSPIVQNGKLIGAVTHVIVNDIVTGYGVYIEYMYEEALDSVKK